MNRNSLDKSLGFENYMLFITVPHLSLSIREPCYAKLLHRDIRARNKQPGVAEGRLASRLSTATICP